MTFDVEGKKFSSFGEMVTMDHPRDPAVWLWRKPI
jgi:hypothetical protein